jgi:chromosome segregation ATPase
MNSPNYTPELTADELEETVELPVLPESMALEPAAVTADAAPANELPPAPEQRGRLENSLRSLTDNLRTLEEKLRAKSEQLSVYEREVGARDRRIAELEAGVASRDKEINIGTGATASLLEQARILSGRLSEAEAARREHAEAHARVVSEQAARESALAHATARLADLGTRTERYSEILQSAEGRRHVYEGMVAEREATIDSAQEQVADLGRQLSASVLRAEAQHQSLQAELDRQRASGGDLERQLQEARRSIAALEDTARRQQAGAEQERQTSIRRTASLENQLSDSNLQATSKSQALTAALELQRNRGAELEQQLLQAQRGSQGLQEQLNRQQVVAEQERQEAARRIGSLERELADNGAQATVRQKLLSDTLAAEKTLVAELGSSVDSLRRDLANAQAQLASGQQNIAGLETELRDHRDLAEVQQEHLSVARLRADNAAADLAATEERLRATESESRQREVRIEHQSIIEKELRERIAQLDSSLEERNALIGRLESEAASSAAVLGSIQHNLESLGNESARHSGQTGNNAVLRLTGEKVARLLVRTKGDSGVVHVLGRRTTIGRTADNDLCVDADSVSRHHAVVLVSGDATVLEDLNSTNGVYVNGARVNRCTLAEGDIIAIGAMSFRYMQKPVSDRGSPA